MLKCPRPSVTCKKGALSACDFLPENNTSSICHGKLQEIVKAGTRRFFRSTFHSRPGIIYPPITCYYLCFDLVVKLLFLAMINMVYCEYWPSPFKWNELHAITQKFKYSRTPSWKKVQTLRVYPSEEIKGRRKELRNISRVNLELLCLVQIWFRTRFNYYIQMANFGLSEDQQILENLPNLWRAIKELKAKDKCENSFLCDDKMEIIFTAFDV